MGYYVGVVPQVLQKFKNNLKEHNRDLQEPNVKADLKNNTDERGLNSSGSR